MDTLNFSHYCSSFLNDPAKADLIFYKDNNETHTYKDLIQSAVSLSNFLKNSQDTFFALQMESSYQLFVHLLAGIIAKKEMLILSHKEPESSVRKYQETIPFSRVLKESSLNAIDSAFPEGNYDNDRSAFIILSSGSSGPSKGISLSLNNVYHSAMGVINFFHMTSQDSSFLNLPHHHIGGLMILWRAFFSGSSVTTNFDDDYQFISLVPLQLKRFMEDSLKSKKLQNCRGVLIGGAPLENYLKELAQKNNIPFFETYGMSETSSLVLLNGKPFPGQFVKLSPEGHFLIRGKTLSKDAPRDEEGFFHTKDIGVQNSDGSFSFKYRDDLLFKSAGELINPLIIESKIKDLPWITKAVVVPVKHAELTAASVLIYKSNDSSKNQNDIKNYLKNEVHPYLIPRYMFEAPKDLMKEGIKPKRFEMSEWAQLQYFKELFHYLYIPNEHAKKIVVFLHGFMEDHTDLIPLMDNHAEVSYLFIDLPGHGRSKIEAFKSRSNIFLELNSLIMSLAGKLPVTLYGYSLGGRVAIELCLNGLSPDLLILESASFGTDDLNEKLERKNLDSQLFNHPSLDLKNFFQTWYKNPIFGKYNQSSHFDSDIEKKLSHDYHEWQNSLEYFSPGATPHTLFEVIDRLKEQKILGLFGSDDLKYKTQFEKIKNSLKNLRLFEIPNAGHNPHKTHLNAVKKILSDLL